jgi:hypothetical protein
MARTKGMLNLSGNLEVNAQAPLDARTIVPTEADLTVASNFPYPYVGLEVYVTGTGKKFRLVNLDTTQSSSWHEIGEGGGGGDASLETSVTANLAVGAIASGTTLPQGTTFTEFAQKLLISEIAPTMSMTMTKTGNVAKGESYNETLSLTVSSMGTAKTIDKIAWYKGSTLLQEDTIGSSTAGTWTYTVADAVTDSATFKAVVTYTKSNDATATMEKTTSISFYYNKFRGVVDTLTPSEATVEALTSALATGKGGTYSFTASNQRICYAYPSSLGALTSIKDGNGFSLFDSFTRTTETYTQAGASVSYYLYVLTSPTTVSSYSVTFA